MARSPVSSSNTAIRRIKAHDKQKGHAIAATLQTSYSQQHALILASHVRLSGLSSPLSLLFIYFFLALAHITSTIQLIQLCSFASSTYYGIFFVRFSGFGLLGVDGSRGDGRRACEYDGGHVWSVECLSAL